MSISSNTGNPQTQLTENEFNADSTFHGSKTNEIVLNIDKWIRQGKRKILTTFFFPETCPHRVIFMGMMSEIQTRKDLRHTRGKVHARVLLIHGSRFRRNLEMWKVPRQPTKESGLSRQNKLRMCILCKKHPILNGCKNFLKGLLKKGGENMHFDASEPSEKMMIDLIQFCQ